MNATDGIPVDRTGDRDIVVGGGGSVAVATAGLFTHAQLLEHAADGFASCSRSIAVIDTVVGSRMLTAADAPLSATRAEAALDTARGAIDDAQRSSTWIAAALRASADAYGMTEQSLTRITQTLGAELGMALGFAGTTVGLFLLPQLLAGVAVIGTGYLVAKRLDPDGTRAAIGALGRWIDAHSGLLRDPAFVAFVRVAVMSSDDVVGGALHIPPPILRMLGDEGFGLTGTDTVAGGIGLVGVSAGAFRESRVSVTASPAVPVAPAHGFADRADRIPEGPVRVRVDRYEIPGEGDRFEVYIAGTSDFSPVAGSDPFDLTSDVAALAGADPGSYRAVELALADAGVTETSPVVITGHSQGGLVGSMLAASGDYRVEGLYTLGAPAAQVPVPDSVPWVAIEHTDDIVPAVGGNWTHADPLLVRREAGDGGDTGAVYPAHSVDRYEQTARMADAADEARLVQARDRLDGFTAGATKVTSTEYTTTRERATG